MNDVTGEHPFALLRRVVGDGPYLERRLGRALAFQVLYEADLARHPTSEILQRVGKDAASPPAETFESSVLVPAAHFAEQVVDGVVEHQGEIDRLIQERAPAWPLRQMSAVDRNVLRIGLYESLFGNAKVPVKAAINEAVELAKAFGSESSAKFVNGVLGKAIQAGQDQRANQQPDSSEAEPRAVGDHPADAHAPEDSERHGSLGRSSSQEERR